MANLTLLRLAKRFLNDQGLAYEDVYNPQLCPGNSIGSPSFPDSSGSFGFCLRLSGVVDGKTYHEDLGTTCHHVIAPGKPSCKTSHP